MSGLLIRAKEFDLGGLALTRLCTLVASLGANVFVIAILARQHGAETYAAYALIASLVNLLPFADLGLGASVVNATADRASGALSPQAFHAAISRARDYMLLVTLVLLPLVLGGMASGQFSGLLGDLQSEPGVLLGAGYTLVCIALSIPLGIGARVLQGHGRMLDVVRLGFINPGVQMAIYLPLFLSAAPASFYFFGPGTAYLLNALVGYLVARQKFGLRTAWPFVALFAKNVLAGSPWKTAVPFLLISVGMAAGFQSHRLLLTNAGSAGQVAEYSVVAQFLGPLIAITGVVGQNLWSRYRGQLNRNELEIGAFRVHLVLFAIIGIAFAFAFTVLMPIAAVLLTGNSVAPPTLLIIGAGAYLLVYSVHQPSAMLLTDPRALWFQATCVIVVAAATILTTLWTVPTLGSAAPYLCMAACMLILQVLPSVRLAILRIRRQEASHPGLHGNGHQ